jgi:membrane protease YdiL (CAAX protease family)
MIFSAMGIFLEIAVLFVFLPIIPLYAGIIPLRHRWTWWTAIFLLLLAIVRERGYDLGALGIRTDNFFGAVVPYGVAAVFGIMVILALARSSKKRPARRWFKHPPFFVFSIAVGALQEFAYRGFLMPELALAIPSIGIVIAINAALFSFAHVIYPNPKVTVPLTFFAGVGFAAIYAWYPNLILAAALHAILNFVATLYGFVSFAEVEGS